ncbi:MAG: HDIG domain-containing protein [Clostridia bacterium]|nr:HDIG domain-containing protein [Clostridia bacterium]
MSTHDKKDKWSIKNHLTAVFSFFVHTVILVAVLFGVVLLNFVDGGIEEFFSKEENLVYGAYCVLTVLLLTVVTYVYYYSEKREFIEKPSNIFMLTTIFAVSALICYGIGLLKTYARPFAFCALLSLLLTDRRSAIFNNSVFCIFMLLIDFVTARNGSLLFEYDSHMVISLIINFISGTTAVFFIDGEGSRIKVLLMGFVVSVPVIISAICLEFTTDLKVLLDVTLSALASGLLADGIMMLLLPFMERIFRALTNFRLTELADHKAKLIKQLQTRAPGTFQHTVQVATIVESCATAIGENPLLARACTYYHDIGKMNNPNYFTENQQGHNPHNELTPELSTDILRGHVRDGASLIRKHRLPEVLADAAEQHHGTTPIRYFYAKARKLTDGDLDIENYCYYGPKPQTKINAIIMICDASEAKVRTISNRSHENVDKAVKEIIEERMDLDQFTECNITLRELDIIRHTITNVLAGVYHERVKYPKLKMGGKNG